MIKKLSTLSGIEEIRPTALNGHEIEDYDLFEVSLSGTPGHPFSSKGWTSSKITYEQLSNNLSASLEDERDCRVVKLTAQGSGQIIGDSTVTIGNTNDHTLNIVAGDHVIISGSESTSKIIISVNITY